MKANDIKKLSLEELDKLLKDEYLSLSGQANILVLRFLEERIKEIEKAVLKVARLKSEFKNLLTVPGIGTILALTVAYETGDIKRFKQVGHYASYSRCVQSQRITNEKVKGRGNRKCGNKYLSLSFCRGSPPCHHQLSKD